MGLREEKKRETRVSIMTTAVGLFREQGYDRTRVQDVAERLRISEATFFNYFPTKHAVLEAVADERLDEAVEQLRQAATGDGGPALARLEELVRNFAAQFAHDRELAVLLVAHTRFAQGETEREGRAHALLTNLLGDGQQRGEIRTDVAASDLATLVMAFMLAMIVSWVSEGGTGPGLEERVLGAFTVFAAGATATAATPGDPTSASPSSSSAEVVGA